MSAFDRIEQQLPELMSDLTSAGLPDYFDDMLEQAARKRQRPAWGAIERWLPMGVIAHPVPMRSVPWRAIGILVILALLIATTLFVYAGSRPRLPAPFGPARNGALVIGSADGDIVSVDPVTGTSTALITGPTFDGGPWFSNDGQRFVFDRGSSTDSQAQALFIANADGSDVRQLYSAGTDIGNFAWSPNHDQGLITPKVNGKGTLAIVNLPYGASTTLALDLDVDAALWRPNHDEFIITATAGDNRTFWVVSADGLHKRQIPASKYAINEPTLSPDGTRLAYATWEPGPNGRIRVVDIDTGADSALTPDDVDGYVWQGPQFSPDGTQLLVDRFIGGDCCPSQVAVLAADGSGSAAVMGPTTENPAPEMMWSPDGTQVLATYDNARTTWMFDPDGQNGRKVPFLAIAGMTWQREAP
jgi:Tol biopolymer transport system component